MGYKMFKTNKIVIVFIVLFLLFTALIICNKTILNETEGPKTENTLIWNLSSVDVTSWDPHLNNSSVNSDIIHQLFEGLTILGEKGYELGVAECFVVSSNSEGVENTVYTFTLRKDAKWSDGKEVTAEDFEYSFKRACNPDLNNQSIGMLTTYIKGAYEYSVGKGTADDMKVNAIDKYTLEIELINSVPYFLEVLSMPQFIPLRKDIIENAGYGWEKSPKTCVSNGPYKVFEYEQGSYLILRKNEEYYNSENVNVMYVKFLINTNSRNTNINDIRNAHVAQIYIKKDTESKDILKSDYVGVYYLVFNVNKEPFNDANARMAVSYALDRKFMSEQVYWGTVPATSIVSPNIKLSDGKTFADVSNSGEEVVRFGINANKPNLESAKKLLMEAGYKNISDFPEVELTVTYDIAGNALKSMIEQNLGISCRVKMVSNEQYNEIKKSGNFQVLLAGWSSDYNDPMTVLNNFTSNSTENYGKWKSANYDLDVENSMKTKGRERDEYLIQAEKKVMDDMVVAPISFNRNYYKINNEIVNGIKIDTLGRLIIKNASMNFKDIINKTENIDKQNTTNYTNNNNRIKEIEEVGFFEDNAGNKFNAYYNSNHFEIYYDNKNVNNKMYAMSISKELENNYDRILNFFEVKKENMPIVKINLYPQYEQFRQSILKEMYFDVNDVGGAAGYTLGPNKIHIMYENQRHISITAIHEFVHCVTYNFTPKKDLPSWIFEGIAMYLSQEDDYYKDKYPEFIEEGLPQKYRLNDYLNRYIYGYSMVEYIINESSKEALLELISSNENIEEVLHISQTDFNEGWRKFIESKIKK